MSLPSHDPNTSSNIPTQFGDKSGYLVHNKKEK